jgi:hypothetical protein
MQEFMKMEPTTGSDSVPFPDGPHCADKWLAYKAACEHAAFIETTDEAATRCWRSASEINVSKAFAQCRRLLVDTYDAHYAAGEEQYIGMSLCECSPVGEWVLSDLVKHWARMSAAWAVMDREEFVKAANDFSVVAATLATGLEMAKQDRHE